MITDSSDTKDFLNRESKSKVYCMNKFIVFAVLIFAGILQASASASSAPQQTSRATQLCDRTGLTNTQIICGLFKHAQQNRTISPIGPVYSADNRLTEEDIFPAYNYMSEQDVQESKRRSPLIPEVQAMQPGFYIYGIRGRILSLIIPNGSNVIDVAAYNKHNGPNKGQEALTDLRSNKK